MQQQNQRQRQQPKYLHIPLHNTSSATSVNNQFTAHKYSKDIGDPILLTDQDRDKTLDVLDSLALDERTGFEVGGDEREEVPFDPTRVYTGLVA